jgi:hypothetical protein
MRREATAALLLLLCTTSRASAVVLAEDEIEETSTTAGAVLRSFAFLNVGDVLEPPYTAEDQSPSASGVFDARLYFTHRTPELKLTVHDQLTMQLRSHALVSPLSVGRGISPPRWLPLTYRDDDSATLLLQSDFDWLYAAYTVGPLTFTLGRQPISFGRGTLWRTTDRISTFSLTEVDTEFKPGADALRIDISASEATSIAVVAAVGELESKALDADASLRGSSFVAQLKHGWDSASETNALLDRSAPDGGDVSGEFGILVGFIRYDAVLGVDGVVDLGELDLYAELTATKLTDESLTGPAADDREAPVMSALLGATLRPVGALMLKPELMFNGFGGVDADGYLAAALSERVAIGEQTTLGQLYGGLTTDWEAHPLTHLFTAAIVNFRDPSALMSAGVNHNLAEDVDVIVGAYVPMGLRPDVAAFELRSEYGNYPYFFFTELKGTI